MSGEDDDPSGQDRWRASVPPGRPMPAAWLAAAAVVAAAIYGWWAVGLAPFSWPATVAVVGAGVLTAAWAAWRGHGSRASGGPDGRRGPDAGGKRASGVVPWALLALAAAVWQLAAYVQHPRADHPTLSSLTNAALDARVPRTAAFVAWLLAIVALVRR